MSDMTQEQMDDSKLRRKWINALKLSDKAEKDWRDKGAKIIEKYRGDKAKKNSFNILYSNTDTLMPAVYNSKAKPDCRRRFADADPLSKAVSDVINRSLSFAMDCDSFESVVELNVLDYLLPGRAVARVRYVPKFNQVPNGLMGEDDGTEPMADEAMDSDYTEELAWEEVTVEHVQYNDFRRGPGRTWDEVQWVAFKHRLTKEEIGERFGKEKAEMIAFDEIETEGSGVNRKDSDKIPGGTCEVWEFWDKDEKNVIFISENYSAGTLSVLDDPLNLINFFPCPKPIYAIPDPTSLIPVPAYEAYREQADELDAISSRISKIVGALRVRGIYDATLSELSNLFNGTDNRS